MSDQNEELLSLIRLISENVRIAQETLEAIRREQIRFERLCVEREAPCISPSPDPAEAATP